MHQGGVRRAIPPVQPTRSPRPVKPARTRGYSARRRASIPPSGLLPVTPAAGGTRHHDPGAAMTDTPLPPMTLGELLRGVRDAFRRSLASLIAFEVIFKLLAAAVLLPSLAALLLALVRWSGRTALSNEDILSFVLSPW